MPTSSKRSAASPRPPRAEPSTKDLIHAERRADRQRTPPSSKPAEPTPSASPPADTTSAANAPKPKPSYHHGDLRRALVDAALSIVASGELQALSLREVARRAGVSAAAPYHHFADKNALLAAVAEEGFVALNAALADAASTQPPEDGWARMVAMGRGYLRFARTHAAHYEVMFLPELKADMHRHPSLHAIAEQSIGALVGVIRAIRPDFAEREAATRTVMVWAAGHGLASLDNKGILKDKPNLTIDEAFFVRAAELMAEMAVGPARPASSPLPSSGRSPSLERSSVEPPAGSAQKAKKRNRA